ncbi:hypothetical protein [uncultured Paludibaculum sp.]|uniref:hypothetical protein n=1 Tax=uncultured Paludibaculum sp. TaxID=1765020 RepID=UPI002AABC9B9|nr:hypothetical protein [uncultured Paludibaculum sp.]
MPKHISIWFFTGVLLLVYGVIIGSAGIYGLSHPPENHVVLESLHIDIWWGAALTLIGAFYCWKFVPTGKE